MENAEKCKNSRAIPPHARRAAACFFSFAVVYYTGNESLRDQRSAPFRAVRQADERLWRRLGRAFRKNQARLGGKGDGRGYRAHRRRYLLGHAL